MRSLIALSTLLVVGCGYVAPLKDSKNVDVVTLETTMGSIEITVFTTRAPASARAFLALVDNGSFERYGSFYRTVRKNENDHGHPVIDVIQGGWQDPPVSLPRVTHESTRDTGLRHQDGTISLARDAVGTATGAEFFICVEDQPALDFGGGRDSFGDGQGFAAFGKVTRGMEVVREIHNLRTASFASDPYVSGQILDPPVRILKAYRNTAGRPRG